MLPIIVHVNKILIHYVLINGTNPSIFTNASGNIYCDQQENCINKFNFYCNGECNDILINNNFATNMVSINCNNGHYNNMSTYNLGVFIIISICNN